MYLTFYIVTIVLVLVMVVKRPAVAFSFMLCTFGFEQWLQSRDVYFIVNTSLMNIASGMVVLYALAIKIKKDSGMLKRYPTEAMLILLLYFYATASTLWSPVPDISSNNLLNMAPYILLMVVLAPVLIQNEDDAYDAMFFIILFGGATLTLLLFFTEWGYRTIILASDSMKYKGNPLAIANLAGYVMLIVILLNLKKSYKTWIIVRISLMVIALVVAVKTESRGQFILMLLISLSLLPVSRNINQIKKFLPLLITAAFVLTAGTWAISEFIEGGGRWDSAQIGADLDGRYDAASRLIEKWYSSPVNLILGLGSSASYSPSIFGFYTHIVPLEILGELGMIGFSLYTAILYVTFKNTRISLKIVSGNNIRKGLLASIVGIVFFEFLLSFKQGSFLGSQVFFGLLVVLALYNKNVRHNSTSSIDEDKSDDNSGSNGTFSHTRETGVRLR